MSAGRGLAIPRKLKGPRLPHGGRGLLQFCTPVSDPFGGRRVASCVEESEVPAAPIPASSLSSARGPGLRAEKVSVECASGAGRRPT